MKDDEKRGERPRFLLCSYICSASYILTFVKVIFRLVAEVKVNPKCAIGTHRAEGASLLPEGKNITSSLL